jgi:hypothetical protein
MFDTSAVIPKSHRLRHHMRDTLLFGFCGCLDCQLRGILNLLVDFAGVDLHRTNVGKLDYSWQGLANRNSFLVFSIGGVVAISGTVATGK